MTINSALSGGNLTTLRAGAYNSRWYLSVVAPEQYATARINQGAFNDAIGELTIDTTSAEWLNVTKGMMVWIGSTVGSRDMGVYRIRKTPIAATMYISELSPGDPGLLALDPIPLADNAYVTIFIDHNSWSVFPRITFAGGVVTFFKDFDDAYADQNETTVPGILNLGAHVTEKVADAATFNHTFTASFTAFEGATVSTYAWFIDETASGSASTLNNTYAVGNYVVRCTVTLSNAAVVTAVRHVRIHDDTNNPATQITISSDQKARRGRTMSVEVIGDYVDELVEGSAVFIWEDVTTGVDSATTQFVGFIDSYDGNMTPGLSDLSIQVVSPLIAASELQIFRQQITFNASPANWQEAVAALMHFDFFTFYMLYYHSTILSLCDLNLAGVSALVSNAWRCDGGNLVDQINRTGSSVNVEITQASDGSLWLQRNPAMLSDSDRSGIVTRMTLLEDDVSEVTYNRQVFAPTSTVEGLALEATTDATSVSTWRAQSPGETPGQGLANERLEGQIVANLNDLRARVANRYAALNNPIPSISASFNYSMDVWEPAIWYFVTLTLGSDIWAEGVSFSQRCIIEDASYSYNEDGTRDITLTLIPETNGNDTLAVELEILPDPGFGLGDFNIPSYDGDDLLIEFDPLNFDGLGDIFGLPLDLGVSNTGVTDDGTPGTITFNGAVMAWSGKLGFTANPEVTAPNWDALHEPDELVVSAVHDPNSPFISDDTQALRVWSVTGKALHFNDDAFGVGTWIWKVAIDGAVLIRHAAGVPGDKGIGIYSAGSIDTTELYIADPLSHVGHVARVANPPGGDIYYIDMNYAGAAPSDCWGFVANIAVISDTLWGTAVATLSPTLTLAESPAVEISGIYVYANNGAITTFTSLLDTTYGSGIWINANNGGYPLLANPPHIDEDEVYHLRFGLTERATFDGELTVSEIQLLCRGVPPAKRNTQIYYSADGGDTGTETVLGVAVGDTGYDLDDYGLGVHLAGFNKGIHSTTAYDGTFSATTTWTGLDDIELVSCIRIPFLQVDAGQAANSDVENLHFIFGTAAAVSAKTLWLGALNASTRTKVSETDITPIISGTTYIIPSWDSLEAAGADTQIILALGVGGGQTDLIYSDDSGGTWAVAQSNVDYDVVRFVLGTTDEAWVFGTDGAAHVTTVSTPFDTLTDKDGDFTTDIGAFPIAGGHVIF